MAFRQSNILPGKEVAAALCHSVAIHLDKNAEVHAHEESVIIRNVTLVKTSLIDALVREGDKLWGGSCTAVRFHFSIDAPYIEIVRASDDITQGICKHVASFDTFVKNASAYIGQVRTIERDPEAKRVLVKVAAAVNETIGIQLPSTISATICNDATRVFVKLPNKVTSIHIATILNCTREIDVKKIYHDSMISLVHSEMVLIFKSVDRPESVKVPSMATDRHRYFSEVSTDDDGDADKVSSRFSEKERGE